MEINFLLNSSPLAAGAGEVTNLGFEDLTYMQDMADYKCYVAKVGETKQLIDSRDNKKYWVTKLADGNCWMTQNLDLDLDGVTLKPTDSDVTSDWVSTTGPSTMTGYNTTDYHKAQYYDAGEYVYTKPTTAKDCNAGADGLAGGTCATDGWVNVSGMAASSDPNFGTGVVDNVYNTHYAVGNYYSWTAAAVESGNDLTANNTDATSSICPKGWTLPKSGSSNNEKDGSFYKLITTSYGIQNAANEYEKIAVPPLYFLLGGLVNNGSLDNAGSRGYYWSSTAISAAVAYVLSFDSSGVIPSRNLNRYYGLPIRCVAR